MRVGPVVRLGPTRLSWRFSPTRISVKRIRDSGENPLVEVLRRHSNNYGAVHRVDRLSRHLAEQPPTEVLVTAPSRYRPTKLSHRLPDETVAAIVIAYQAGATTRELGERYGLAHSSVNKLLKQRGIRARRRGQDPEETQYAVELYRSGESMRTIAKQLGFGLSTIRRAILRADTSI